MEKTGRCARGEVPKAGGNENPTEASAELLLERVAARDHEAFLALYDRFAPRLFGLIMTIVHDRDASQDVLQQVTLELWERHASRYRAALGSAESWLLRLARSRAIDRVRSAARTRRRESGDEPGAADATTRTLPDDPERRAAIAAALAELPEGERTPLELAFLQGMTREEIAEHCGVPVGTVKTRIRRAVARLRDSLAPAAGGEG